MSVTERKRPVPTVATVIERFIASRQNQHVKEYICTLQGARSRHVTGKRAAGVTLARSQFGDLRFDRVEGHEFAAWLHQRHPRSSQAASTFKKGRSALCQLLKYAIANGWADATVLAALPKACASPPRGEWLRPEQVAALNALVSERHFTSHQCFMWSCLLNAGVRSDELVRLQPPILNAIDGTLQVIGKGRGDGKLRSIPVSPEFQEEWSAYVREHAPRPTSWLFPVTQVRFVKGERFSYEHAIADESRHCTQKPVRTAVAKVRALAVQEVAKGRMDPSLVPSFALTPKVLRSTYACSNLILHSQLGPGFGLDLRSLQQAMGHESLDTTAMYLGDVADYLNRHRRTMSITDGVKRLAEQPSAASAFPDALAA